MSLNKKLSVRELAGMNVIKYFDHFSYALTFQQLHAFFPILINQSELLATCEQLIGSKYLENSDISVLNTNAESLLNKKNDRSDLELSSNKKQTIYALGGHSIYQHLRVKNQGVTHAKLQKLQTFISLMKVCPWIKLVGLSGSCAMNNATEDDDVDIFIITSANRMWLGRLYAVLCSEVLGMRRRKAQRNIRDRVCLNMFFDIQDLAVPMNKQNLYVAHEVIQMIPLYIRGRVYSQFLASNSWVLQYFPNLSKDNFISSETVKSTSTSQTWGLTDILEAFARRMQYIFINRSRTKEIVTDTQLWFFPRDYQEIIFSDRSIQY